MDRRAWPMLSQLDVRRSRLKSAGIEAIAEIAREAGELTWLDMSRNESGGRVVAGMLKQSKRLAWSSLPPNAPRIRCCAIRYLILTEIALLLVDARQCKLGMEGAQPEER